MLSLVPPWFLLLNDPYGLQLFVLAALRFRLVGLASPKVTWPPPGSLLYMTGTRPLRINRKCSTILNQLKITLDNDADSNTWSDYFNVSRGDTLTPAW